MSNKKVTGTAEGTEMQQVVIKERKEMTSLEQEVSSNLSAMGITEETPNYAAILSSFVAAKERELELAAENERLRNKGSRAVRVVLPPAKQLVLGLIEEMDSQDDKHEENFKEVAAVVLAAAQKLAASVGLEQEDDVVLDFTKELMHYQDSKDSLIYLIQDSFATAKAQNKVTYGRKRQANSATATPATPAVADTAETEAPVF